jgi:hypothetical protein
MATHREKRDAVMSIIYNMTQTEFLLELESNQIPDFVRATKSDNDYYLTPQPKYFKSQEKNAYENRLQLRQLSIKEFVFIYLKKTHN